MKKRAIIGATMLLLAVGFAAISTTLIINGNVHITENIDDFDIFFSSSILDNVDISNESISQDKKTITFFTNDLKKINDESNLKYEVTNNSTQYDAEVKIECSPTDNELYKLENNIDKDVIEAKSYATGNLKVTLKKAVIDEQNLKFSCTLNIVATERTSAISSDVNYPKYILSGIFLDETENPIKNASLVIYSDDPKYITTSSDGSLNPVSLERGNHEIYYIDKSLDEIKNMDKKTVISESIASATFTTESEGDVIFTNNSKIKNSKIELTKSYCESIVNKEFRFDYIGDYQEFIIPCNGNYELTTYGGGGSSKTSSDYNDSTMGSMATATISLSNDTKLYVYVGGKENSFNGGGVGGTTLQSVATSKPGSGATDIRLIKASENSWYDLNHTSWNTDESLLSRIITAGGGGGKRANAGRRFNGSTALNTYFDSSYLLYDCYGIDGEKGNDVLGLGSNEVTGTSKLTDSGDIGLGASGGAGGGYYGGQTSAESKNYTYSQFSSIMGANNGSGKGAGIVAINGNRLVGTEVHAYNGTSYVNLDYNLNGKKYEITSSSTTTFANSGNGYAIIKLISVQSE